MTELVEKPKRRVRQDYTAAEKTRGLIAVAAANGNTRKAERDLAEDGIDIDHSTLWCWQKAQPEEYQRIRAELLPRIREQQADAHRALEARQLSLAQEAAQRIKERLPQMDDRDLINAMGKADIGSGIHAEKAQLLNSEPTQIVQRDASEILNKLKSKGVVVDAEVVSEEDVTPTA